MLTALGFFGFYQLLTNSQLTSCLYKDKSILSPTLFPENTKIRNLDDPNKIPTKPIAASLNNFQSPSKGFFLLDFVLLKKLSY